MGGAAIPAFDLEGGVALALVRGLSVAALLSVFGALLFRAALAPPVLASMQPVDAALFRRRWRFLLWSSWSAALVATLAWLVLQASSMADAGSVHAAASATRTVLADTSFGHVLLLRLGVLVLMALVLGGGERRLWIATGLAAIATALQGGHSHAASMEGGPSLLLLSEVVHLLAAGAWLGGLMPLMLLVASAPLPAAAHASRRFSPLGTSCVLLLAVTASFQFWVLIGDLPGLIGTGYGLLVLLKVALFVVLLGLAGRNRFRLTPALVTASAEGAKRRLCRSVTIETGFGLLVVLAAGFLTSLPPAMHVQPLWPFAKRLSLEAVGEDSDFLLEVIQAGLALAGALALLVMAILSWRLRWPAVALSAVICWFAVPHFDLLLAEAYPTSFYQSPTDFAAAGIVEGARLYPEHCASCHGAEGRGDGPAAAGLRIPPADLTAGHLWMHSDGELFWWLSHGIDAPDGGQAMPGFAAVLSDDQRWGLIDYVRAHNAGLTVGKSGVWPQPIQAPGLQAECDGKTLTLQELRGRFVRLIIGKPPPAAAEADVVTIVAAAHAEIGGCVADDEALPLAYGIVSGVPGHELPGTQFLIDDQGWLRAFQRLGQPGSWNEPEALAAEIRDLREHPIAAPDSGGHMNMPM